MASSAIRYRDAVLFIRDNDLGELLKAISINLAEESGESLEALAWLLEACQSWMDDYEDLPPGLKDIELDQWLGEINRQAAFIAFLRKVGEKGGTETPYNWAVANRAIQKLIAIVSSK